MPSPEESNAAMRIIEKFRGEYDAGGVGLPPGQDWVDSAFAYMDYAGIYTDEAAARELLDGYDILTAPPPPDDDAERPEKPPTFEEAIDDPEWWNGFRAFVEGEFSSENTDFVDAVRYQSMDPQAIFDTFVVLGSPREVNISDGARAAAADAFNGGGGDYATFDEAVDIVRRLMKQDSWKRYLRSVGFTTG